MLRFVASVADVTNHLPWTRGSAQHAEAKQKMGLVGMDETPLVTQIIALDSASPDAATLADAASILRAGGLVAFPTETVYGLGANALDATAVERIFAAKGRPAHDPLIVHVVGLDWLPAIAAEVPPLARRLAAQFWPGPLTLVLHCTAQVPDGVTAGGETVAVRAPNHPIAQALLHASGVPIAAPSANRFGHTSPTTAQHVLDDLGGRIEMILDGGATPIGVESTVLDVTQTPPVVLRHGGVPIEALRAAVGAVAERAGDAQQTVLVSPGLLDRHYAPHTPLRLFRGEGALGSLLAQGVQMRQAGTRVCVLAFAEDEVALAQAGLPTVALGAEAQLEEVARRLYGALRAADVSGADVLLAREPRGEGIGAALRDRLGRAAERSSDE